MDPDAQLDDATTRLATLTPIKDRGDGSPSAEAREQARLIRKQRNARVEAWRDIVAISASDCTCVGSSPPSSFVDSTASWGAAVSNATTTGELPSVQEPVESPATTVSAWKQDGPGSASAVPQCRHCSRLGAPSFMGEKEVDEYVEIPQPRRTSSISKMLKQFTTRIGLGDRRSSGKRPSIPRTGDALGVPPPPGPAGVQPASRDSFAESRKTKMKQTHRDRQRHEHHGSVSKKRSVFGGKAGLDLNQVNEALITQSPAGHSENLTYRRAGHCSHAGMKASSTSLPVPRDGKRGDDSLSLSTNEEEAAANPIATQKIRQATRGMERMARAQQLLNRVKDLGDPCGDETPNSRPQATAGKGGPMARRAAPPVQAPA